MVTPCGGSYPVSLTQRSTKWRLTHHSLGSHPVEGFPLQLHLGLGQVTDHGAYHPVVSTRRELGHIGLINFTLPSVKSLSFICFIGFESAISHTLNGQFNLHARHLARLRCWSQDIVRGGFFCTGNDAWACITTCRRVYWDVVPVLRCWWMSLGDQWVLYFTWHSNLLPEW